MLLENTFDVLLSFSIPFRQGFTNDFSLGATMKITA